jgi:8-amino-7-oxononanoate synthase
MLTPAQNQLLDDVDTLKKSDRYPFLPTIMDINGNHVEINGFGNVLMFASCDYLGISQAQSVKDAAIAAVHEFGTNTFGAQIFSGYTRLHRDLEIALAQLTSKQAALLFPSGMHANIGTLSTFLGNRDVVIQDRLNHVSLLMGTKQAGATQRSYRHSDMGHLETILKDSTSFERRMIVTDGVFSADGDIAKLDQICDLAERYDAAVMVDDAHGFGVFGENGCGVAEHLGCLDRVDIISGTMSKAFGSVGGFIVGEKRIIEALRHLAPAYTSSRGSPPAVAAASLAALQLHAQQGSALRDVLKTNIQLLLTRLRGAGFDCLNAEAACVPVRIGSQATTIEVARWLLDKGILVNAMVPPTVPPGGSRLRIGVSAAHSPSEIESLIAALIESKVLFDY